MHRRETEDLPEVVATPIDLSLTPGRRGGPGPFRRSVARKDALNRTKHFEIIRGDIRPVPTVFCDDVAVASHRMIPAHPQIEVVVFASAKCYVESSRVQQAPSIVHNSPMHSDLVAPQECDVGVRSDIVADRPARNVTDSINKAITPV